MSPEHARALARDHYGLEATARALPGEADLNFLLAARAGAPSPRRYVLKVAAAHRSRTELEFQVALLRHLAAPGAEARLGIATPRVVPNRAGRALTQLADGRLAHLLDYVPGRPLRRLAYRPPELLAAWGKLCGRLSRALADFDHAGAHRAYRWCPSRAADAGALLADLPLAPERRAIAERHRAYFTEHTAPTLAELPHQVNYNDAHEDNLLVDEHRLAPRITGLVDVGDAVWAPRVCELAVACAYAAMDCPDPVARMQVLAKAYTSECPLAPAEVDALYGLTVGRLLITVAAAAEARAHDPANAYRTVSERQAWDLLRRLDAGTHPRLARYRLREACGLPVRTPVTPPPDLAPVIALAGRPLAPLDLSVGSATLGHYTNYTQLAAFARRIDALRGDGVGHGGYLETRPCYTTDLFAERGNDGPRWRTVHLGLDLWSPAGEPVYAPLAGTVHGFRQNDAPRDYGATIVLAHTLPCGATVHTLYGHLSADSLADLEVGRPVARGEAFAKTGDTHENGGWPPHLHFQVIADPLDREGDFPGVCFPEESAVWAALCPDPAAWCGLPLGSPLAEAQRRPGTDGPLLARRRRALGRSLSLSYAPRPLHIVRGAGAYLLDADGRRYLDLVNNVAHVGHEHPAVVAAVQRQAAVLNTNTRYLHGEIVAFAEELRATLPPALSVVHVVNSGSEANELALRMARAATGQRDVVAVEAGYHGNTGGAIDVSGYKFDGPGGEGAPATTHLVPIPDVYRGRHRDAATAGAAYAGYLDAVIAQLAERGRAPAAFLCESVLSCGGQVVLPAGYLRAAYAKTRGAGGVCIADEVQVGVGRVGTHFWGFELQGVVPDLVTVGKPIGNGHPLAAVVCTERVADAFAATGMEYFNTFGGNPVSCAAGRAVLRVVREEGLQARAAELGDYLLDGLRDLRGRHAAIGDVRGAGLFAGFELVRDRDTRTPDAELAAYLARRGRERGLLLSTDGPHRNVMKLKPPLCIARGQLAWMLEEVDGILAEA